MNERVVGSYRIITTLGEGGMGTVYKAVDVMLEREVAIKAIRPEFTREPEVIERFRAEAKMLARISHPAIATIYSFFVDQDDLFLAMEYVPGETLARLLQRDGPMPWERAVPLLAGALDGIEQAHNAGIVHRDLKPDNLMITPNGAMKVMDFGIARAVGSGRLTRTGLLIGTLRYMSPEQIRGEEVDRRTDVYALGTVLYEMVTGRVPFDGASDYAILKAHVEESPLAPSATAAGVPGWLDEAILKSLAKDPAKRFQTVAELRLFMIERGDWTHTTAVRLFGAGATLISAPGAVLMPTPPPLAGPAALSLATAPIRTPVPVAARPVAAAAPAAVGAVAAGLAAAGVGGLAAAGAAGADHPTVARPAPAPPPSSTMGGAKQATFLRPAAGAVQPTPATPLAPQASAVPAASSAPMIAALPAAAAPGASTSSYREIGRPAASDTAGGRRAAPSRFVLLAAAALLLIIVAGAVIYRVIVPSTAAVGANAAATATLPTNATAGAGPAAQPGQPPGADGQIPGGPMPPGTAGAAGAAGASGAAAEPPPFNGAAGAAGAATARGSQTAGQPPRPGARGAGSRNGAPSDSGKTAETSAGGGGAAASASADQEADEPAAGAAQESGDPSERIGGLPAAQLRWLAVELRRESEYLHNVYETALAHRSGGTAGPSGGAETAAKPRDAEARLRDEITALQTTAEHFATPFQPGFFSRTRERFGRLTHGEDERTHVVRLAKDLTGSGAKLDAAMTEAHPEAQVRKLWSHMRRQIARVAEICGI